MTDIATLLMGYMGIAFGTGFFLGLILITAKKWLEKIGYAA